MVEGANQDADSHNSGGFFLLTKGVERSGHPGGEKITVHVKGLDR